MVRKGSEDWTSVYFESVFYSRGKENVVYCRFTNNPPSTSNCAPFCSFRLANVSSSHY